MTYTKNSMLVASVAVATIAAGCSGGSMGSTPGLPVSNSARSADRGSWRRFVNPEAGHGAQVTVWVLPGGASMPVLKYQFGEGTGNKGNAAPVCTSTQTVTNHIQVGLNVSPKGQLWVTNQNWTSGSGTGYVQRFGCTGGFGPKIQDLSGLPSGIAFDTKGNIYLENLYNFNASGNQVPGSVLAYTSGGKLIGSMSDPSIQSAWGIAIDHQNNCYISAGTDQIVNEILKFPNCKPASAGIVLAGPRPYGAASTPEFDSKGNLIVFDQSAVLGETVVEVFSPPYNAAPTKTVKIPTDFIYYCPLDQSEHHLYCGGAYSEDVDVYSYPGIKYLYSFNNGMWIGPAIGVAVSPRASL